jgi:hypothetical protein
MREVSGTPLEQGMEGDARRQRTALLLDAVYQSARLRFIRAIDRNASVHVSFGEAARRHYYDALADARKALNSLAKFCRDNRLSMLDQPLFELCELQAYAADAYESGRKFEVDQITSVLLYEVGIKGWSLYYQDWIIKRGRLTEMDDHYGLPTYGHPLLLSRKDGFKYRLDMPWLRVQRAREAYYLITGQVCIGDDGLGADPEHPAERCA